MTCVDVVVATLQPYRCSVTYDVFCTCITLLHVLCRRGWPVRERLYATQCYRTHGRALELTPSCTVTSGTMRTLNVETKVTLYATV